MNQLNQILAINKTGHKVVLFAWVELAILHDYTPAYSRLEGFLVSVGQRKCLTPLYRAMKETGKIEMARRIYGAARQNYHAVAYNTMDELLVEE